MKTALALDGGGIRGYLSVLILKDLESRLLVRDGIDPSTLTTSYLYTKFDLITGTSTGAILAAAIASGKKLDEIEQLYRGLGPEIFVENAKAWWQKIKLIARFGPSSPNYTDKALGKWLRENFKSNERKDLRLGDVHKPVCLQVYDATLHEPVVFKSHGNSERNQHNENLPLWEVIKASASAPTFFPAHLLQCRKDDANSKSWYEALPDDADKQTRKSSNAMIDGGVYAANPAAIALAELYVQASNENADKHDFVVVSVGTGEQATKPIVAADGREFGIVQWALPLVNIFMGGVSKHTHNLVKRVLADNYYRFEIILSEEIPMDTGKDRHFETMRSNAAQYLSDFPEQLSRKDQHDKEGYLYSSQVDKLLLAI